MQFVFIEIQPDAHPAAQTKMHHGELDLEGVRRREEAAHRRIGGQIALRRSIVEVAGQKEASVEDAGLIVEGERRQIERVEILIFSHGYSLFRRQIY